VKPPPPPIRFLLAVVGCWIGARAFLLWPETAADVAESHESAAPAAPLAEAAALTLPAFQPTLAPFPQWAPSYREASQPIVGWSSAARWVPGARGIAPAPVLSTGVPVGNPRFANLPAAFSAPPPAPAAPRVAYPPILPFPTPAGAQAAAPGPRRWSGSAWLFLRTASGEPGLAPGGTLGGSQAGARLAYRINGDARAPLAVSVRLYVPLERPQGAEAALGIDWQPLASLQLHLLAERREKIGREGRSDFALTVYGGGERRLLRGRLRLEAYGQAGVVGAEDRDLFADGSVRASTPVGPVEIGAGAWGGAQRGAARLDVGPQVSLRVPVGRTGIRASAEWRLRVAGEAQPGSGPVLTLATDF
jgi:hypothetical protein